MSQRNLLDEIRRIKKSVKPVSKRAKLQQQQQLSTLQKTLSQAHTHRMQSSKDKFASVSSPTNQHYQINKGFISDLFNKLDKSDNSSTKQKSKSKSFTLSNSSSSSSLNKQHILQVESNYQNASQNFSYSGLTFYFEVRDVELTAKRLQIFEKLIKKRGGIVLNQRKACKNGVNYILTTKNISKYTFKQHLQSLKESSKDPSMQYGKVLNFNYLIDCQKQNKLLQTDQYQLFKQIVSDSSNTAESQIGRTRKLRHIQQEITDDDMQHNHQNSTISLSTKSIPRMSRSQATQKINFSMKSFIPKKQLNKQKFACQNGSSSCQFPVNQYIYEQLMKFYSIYQNEKDTGRKIAYLKAASAIKSYHKQIQSQKDILNLRGIGKKIVDKVKQLLQTGQIQKLQKLQQSQQNLICQQFCRVWGIGASKAKQLYLKGIKSLKQLQQKQDFLNKNQKIGLKYVNEFQQRIPKQKAKKMFEFVRGRLWQLVGTQQIHMVQICGSFRRGKATCGDIDIIISRKDGIYQQNLVIDLINKLQKLGFLTDHLSIPSIQQNKPMSYMGVCVFQSPIHHRIDIKYYPISQYPFAVLYFTGSDMFNRSMRLYARKKGYSLSDRGLVPVERADCKKIWKGKEIDLGSQRGIFQFLQLQYKEPWQRDI